MTSHEIANIERQAQALIEAARVCRESLTNREMRGQIRYMLVKANSINASLRIIEESFQ